MNDIEKLINDTTWADRTKKNRINFIISLKKNIEPNSKGLSFLKNFNIISDYLLKTYSNPNTRKNKILDIRSILTLLNDTKTIKRYEALTHTLIDDNNKHKGNNIIDNPDKIIPYEDLIEIPNIISENIEFIYNNLFLDREDIEKLKTDTAKYKYLKLLTQYIISILYTKEPPVRADWVTVLLDIKSDKENWLNTKKGEINWNQFKNIKSMGPKVFHLSTPTINALHHYIFILKYIIKDPKYLIYQIHNNTYKPFSREVFSTYFINLNKQYLMKPLSINSYRKIYETHIINLPNYNKLTNNEKDLIHNKLLHSRNTANSDYLKIDNPINLKEFEKSI